jgi:hypothetical protein
MSLVIFLGKIMSSVRFHLSTGLKSALSEVIWERMQESKRAWRDYESEFEKLNGVSYGDYSQPGKKLPSRLPL